METGLGVWADLVMDAVEVAVLGAVLWQLFNLRHDIEAMLRVVRRMDRKTADTLFAPSGGRQSREQRSECYPSPDGDRGSRAWRFPQG